ncbi:hypothetical protein CFC21_021338, partial [Triticum aestivum]
RPSPSRSRVATPSTMSRPRSRTRRASHFSASLLRKDLFFSHADRPLSFFDSGLSSSCRDPAGPAAADLRGEAAGGRAHAGRLQHTEGADAAPRAPPARGHHRALAPGPRPQ